MITQKVNYSPNFSAKTRYIDEHKNSTGDGEHHISIKARSILRRQPKLKQGQAFVVFYEGHDFNTAHGRNYLSDLNVAICDKKGNRLTDKINIYHHKETVGEYTSLNIGEMRRTDFHNAIRQVAQELRKNLDLKTKELIEALRLQAKELGLDLVQRARRK